MKKTKKKYLKKQTKRPPSFSLKFWPGSDYMNFVLPYIKVPEI